MRYVILILLELPREIGPKLAEQAFTGDASRVFQHKVLVMRGKTMHNTYTVIHKFAISKLQMMYKF